MVFVNGFKDCSLINSLRNDHRCGIWEIVHNAVVVDGRQIGTIRLLQRLMHNDVYDGGIKFIARWIPDNGEVDFPVRVQKVLPRLRMWLSQA